MFWQIYRFSVENLDPFFLLLDHEVSLLIWKSLDKEIYWRVVEKGRLKEWKQSGGKFIQKITNTKSLNSTNHFNQFYSIDFSHRSVNYMIQLSMKVQIFNNLIIQ